MKKITPLLILISVSIAAISCKDNKYSELEKAKWLLGSWENRTADGVLTETWEKENDSTFSGISYFLKNNDTLSKEKIALQQRGTELSYIATVPSQNGGSPVPFVMTSISDKQFVFENSKHDFPQRIAYNLIQKDSISAEISGTQSGKEKNETFPLKKVK